jgi:hypothetical protein
MDSVSSYITFQFLLFLFWKKISLVALTLPTLERESCGKQPKRRMQLTQVNRAERGADLIYFFSLECRMGNGTPSASFHRRLIIHHRFIYLPIQYYVRGKGVGKETAPISDGRHDVKTAAAAIIVSFLVFQTTSLFNLNRKKVQIEIYIIYNKRDSQWQNFFFK